MFWVNFLRQVYFARYSSLVGLQALRERISRVSVSKLDLVFKQMSTYWAATVFRNFDAWLLVMSFATFVLRVSRLSLNCRLDRTVILSFQRLNLTIMGFGFPSRLWPTRCARAMSSVIHCLGPAPLLRTSVTAWVQVS